MNLLHKFTHAHDTVRTYNYIVSVIDRCLSLSKNENVYGVSLEQTVEILKQFILEDAVRITDRSEAVDTFIGSHDSYDLTEFTDKSHAQILTIDKPKADTFAVSMTTIANNEQVKDLKKLENATSDINNTLSYCSPINIDLHPDHLHALRVNNWLDAISYICKNIHYDNGTAQSWTENEQREMINNLRTKAANFAGFSYPDGLKEDIENMKSVINWLSVNASEPLKIIGDYIDINQPKLPLIRRNWAL